MESSERTLAGTVILLPMRSEDFTHPTAAWSATVVSLAVNRQFSGRDLKAVFVEVEGGDCAGAAAALDIENCAGGAMKVRDARDEGGEFPLSDSTLFDSNGFDRNGPAAPATMSPVCVSNTRRLPWLSLNSPAP